MIRVSRSGGRVAFLAALAALLAGAVGIVLWVGKSVDTGLNDTGTVRPGPSQELLWVSQALLIAGAGTVIALLVGRRSPRAMWGLLALTGLLAIAVPWLRTDWSLRHDRRQMDAIADPPGWRLHSYAAIPLYNGDGRYVGRRLTKAHLPSSSLTTATLLAHYQAQLPGLDGRERPTNGSQGWRMNADHAATSLGEAQERHASDPPS